MQPRYRRRTSPSRPPPAVIREGRLLGHRRENLSHSGRVAARTESGNDLPKNKALPLVVLCPTGARASRAVGILRKLGYANSRALAGGFAAWREANLPVEKSQA